MGRPSAELAAACKPYVAVRVTDMQNVDLNVIRFDFDLTFAAVLMHADGTVYHRYGSRGPDDASTYLSLSSLAALLHDTLADHRDYERAPSPPKPTAPLPAIELPVLQQKVAAGARLDCVHCHTINDATFAHAFVQKTWRRDDAYVFPDPTRIGLALDRERQARITAVTAGSPAAAAGLRAGDDLVALGVQKRVRTQGDVQWALHEAPFAKNRLPVRFARDGSEHDAALDLADGWKRCPPEEYAWRPFKWNLSPSCGFGGPALDAGARTKLGLPDAPFAMRVQYVVDWGERAARGRAATAAGLRKGDVVIGFAGKRDFTGFDHLHAWVGLTLTAGAETEIVVWRQGKEHVLRYRLPE
ncbi:MAG: PDZ domain-containing protein [Planctomycetes bacterium]|nr:PDZ domain-containing protein [Planctomycetota bacterium]